MLEVAGQLGEQTIGLRLIGVADDLAVIVGLFQRKVKSILRVCCADGVMLSGFDRPMVLTQAKATGRTSAQIAEKLFLDDVPSVIVGPYSAT